MNHVEIFRRVRNGDYKYLAGLDEYELTRFIAYLLQRIKKMEEREPHDK